MYANMRVSNLEYYLLPARGIVAIYLVVIKLLDANHTIILFQIVSTKVFFLLFICISSEFSLTIKFVLL